MTKKIRITQVKSAIGYPSDQKVTIRTLGLRRLHQQIEHQDTPQIRGDVKKSESSGKD